MKWKSFDDDGCSWLYMLEGIGPKAGTAQRCIRISRRWSPASRWTCTTPPPRSSSWIVDQRQLPSFAKPFQRIQRPPLIEGLACKG